MLFFFERYSSNESPKSFAMDAEVPASAAGEARAAFAR